jgi:hypothetical protein
LIKLLQGTDLHGETPHEFTQGVSEIITFSEAARTVAMADLIGKEFFGSDLRSGALIYRDQYLTLQTQRGTATTLLATLPESVSDNLNIYTIGRTRALISARSEIIRNADLAGAIAPTTYISENAFHNAFNITTFRVSGIAPTFVSKFYKKGDDPKPALTRLFSVLNAKCGDKEYPEARSVAVICDYHSEDFPLPGNFASSDLYWSRIAIMLSADPDDSIVVCSVLGLEIFNAGKASYDNAKRHFESGKGRIVSANEHKAFAIHFKENLRSIVSLNN